MGTKWGRGSSVWTWARTSSLWGWRSTGTGCPGRLWSLLLWRYSRPAWTRFCAACCRWPCFGRRVGLNDPQRSLSTPTILWFGDSVIVCFTRWIAGIHLVSLPCDVGVHDKRLSGQLLRILPPLAMAQWENKLFTNIFVAFFLRSHKLNVCYHQPVLKWNLHTLFCHCPCLFLTVNTQSTISSERWNVACNWIKYKGMMLLPSQIFYFAILNLYLSFCFHECNQYHFHISCSREFLRNWCTFPLTYSSP